MTLQLTLRLAAFFVGALLNGVLAFGVLRRRQSQPVERVLRLFFGALFLWFVGSLIAGGLASANGLGASVLRRLGRVVAHAGLAFMPSLVLHATVCEARDRFTPSVRSMSRVAVVIGYLPLVGIVYPMWQLWRLPERLPIAALAPLVRPWNSWFALVLLVAAGLTLWSSRRETGERRRMLVWLAWSFVAIAFGLVYAYVLGGHSGSFGYTVETVVMASSLLPSMVFAYFVYRYRVLGFVFQDRTLSILAGGCLVALYLFVVRSVTGRLELVLGIPERLLDGAILIAIMVAVEPVAASLGSLLRRLLGGDREQVRRRVARAVAELAQARTVDEIALAILPDWTGAAGIDGSRLLLAAEIPTGVARVERLALAPTLAGEFAGATSVVRRHDGAASVCAELDALSADVALALRTKGRLYGALLLLSKRSPWTTIGPEIVELVEPVAQATALALEAIMLTEQKLLAERLAARNERMAAIGWLTASVAHEVKNPLGSIKAVGQVLLREIGPENRWRQDALVIVREADRMREAVNRLLTQVSDDDAGRAVRPVDLTTVLDQMRIALEPLARCNGVRFDVVLFAVPTYIDAADGALWDVLYNMAMNGVEAMAAGGTLRFEQVSSGQPGIVRLRISDEGPGVPSDLAQRIFEPSFTTKASGHGLGLTIVARRLSAMGGTVTLMPTQTGASFEITLPLASESSAG